MRVLVTDAEERAALAVVRGLAAAGHDVTACATGRAAAGLWSRSCRSRHVVPDPRASAEAFVDALRAILLRSRHDVVVPGTDVSVLALSTFRERLDGTGARHGLPPHEDVLRCLDKGALLEAARGAGLHDDGAVVCADAAELRDAAARLGVPLVVKPLRSFRLGEDGRFHQSTAAVVRSESELAEQVFPLLAEPFHEGAAVVSSAGVVVGGELLAHVVSRYYRTWPPVAGSASLSETIAPPPELRAQTESVARELGWSGMFELELLDVGAGRLKAIDFNPRTYGSLALALSAGSNLPALWCAALADAAQARVPSAAPGLRYRCEDAEAANLVAALRGGRLAEAMSIVRPRQGTTHAYFRLSDPLPLAARLASIVAKRTPG